ncbi:unnamed protein product [Clavelina lepadiformis]|uniref:Transporter n=1 Tax=Clavelina lepadiformis TaxID=159417 RepID=A0ABP0FF03_CLALP
MAQEEPKKEKWSKSVDFAFACAGGCIGYGNVWRFPYICYANGGGAFLIPYLLVAFTYGLPLFIMESSFGQLTDKGMIGSWDLVPIFKGVGYASLVMTFCQDAYCLVLQSWLLRYMVASFQSALPWETCYNSWNSENCTHILTVADLKASSNVTQRITLNSSTTTSVIEFWEREVLQLSVDVNHIGHVNWKMLLCLIAVIVIVYLCIWKSIKWASKIVYVTVPLPYLLLLAVLVRGMTLDGAMDGIGYYLKPNITKLKEPEVWLNATEQVCFSYGICLGVVTVLGSRNKKNHNFVRDSLFIVVLNVFTSFIAGFAVFSLLGFMAKQQNTTVDAVAEAGPGLAFIAYPQAISMLPLAPFWGALFFLMMFFLGLDSAFVYDEALCTTVFDLLPLKIRRRSHAMEKTFAVVMLVLFVFGITMVTEGGLYVFQIFQFGGTGWCLIFNGIFQSIAVGWVLGADKYIEIMSNLLGYSPKLLIWCKYCWKYFIPLAAPAAIIYALIRHERMSYSNGNLFPDWAEAIAWILTLAPVLCVPSWILYYFLKTPGNFSERWETIMTPQLFDEDEEAGDKKSSGESILLNSKEEETILS